MSENESNNKSEKENGNDSKSKLNERTVDDSSLVMPDFSSLNKPSDDDLNSATVADAPEINLNSATLSGAPAPDLDLNSATIAEEPSDGKLANLEALTINDVPDDVENLWAATITEDVNEGMTLKLEDEERKADDDVGKTTHVTVNMRTISDNTKKTTQDPSLSAGVRTVSESKLGEFSKSDVDYELLKVLGEGGMGTVYQARQTSIDRSLAVKMIKAEFARDNNAKGKFLAEAAVTGDLDHPNIVPIHDLGDNGGGLLFYSMKQVRGKPWSDEIKEKTLNENLDILESVNNAMAFAHDRGIMHRDLKPENIMTGGYGEVMVMDWGLAAAFKPGAKADRLKDKTAVCGTPAYMAPEMAVGNGKLISKESDIYLLGAMLFEIITGYPPHTGKTVIECLKNAATGVFRKTEVKGELMDIARKAMSEKPEDRYSTVKEFQDAIKEYESHHESISLADRAAKDLQTAEKTGVYEDYSRSVFGFQEALNLWKENKRAADGLSQARLSYAACALGKDDLDLAESQLVENKPEFLKLKEKVDAARAERDRKEHNLKVAKKAGIVLVSIIIFGGIIAGIWINSERKTALAESEKAKKASAEAQKNLADMRRIEAKEGKLKLLIHAMPEDKAIELQKSEAEKLGLPVSREVTLSGNGAKMKFSFIPAGIFTMGSHPEEKNREATESLHDVTITKPFYMAVYEMTREQWKGLFPGDDPSTFKGKDFSPRHPVETVSYNDIINKVLPAIQKFAPSGFVFDLPTEAEWEYACRTNSKYAYGFGADENDLGKYGWYMKNSEKKTHYTGGKKPNAWGLYDMHGNVAEWCKDNFVSDYYLNSPDKDPVCLDESPFKSVRGGCWPVLAKSCRTAYRTSAKPNDKFPFLGFRLILRQK